MGSLAGELGLVGVVTLAGELGLGGVAALAGLLAPGGVLCLGGVPTLGGALSLAREFCLGGDGGASGSSTVVSGRSSRCGSTSAQNKTRNIKI